MRVGGQHTYRYNADDERVVRSVGSGQSRTYMVNGLSEFSTDGGPITWTVDYLYVGSRLLGAVRPALGSVYTLTVTKLRDGAGRVSGLPAGLDCGPECTARYVSGTRVTLTATAETGSYFTGWGGACSGTATTVDVTIDAVKTCTATFVSNKLTVTLAGSGTGTVSASGLTCQGTQCTGVYPLQTPVTLVATPLTGSAFAGWSGDAGCGASVTMTAALNCTVTFTLTTSSYTLTVLKTGEGSAGSVVASTPPGIACGATCAASFISGTAVQLTATPATGYELAFWQGDGCATGTVTMTGARTCTAWFQPIVLPCNPTPTELQVCRSRGGRWDSEMCACRFGDLDPLVLTLDGAPIHLTDLAGGVAFDVNGDGVPEPVSWTQAGSGAGWLVLDLDGDGAITTGAELFGVEVEASRRGKPTGGKSAFTLLAAYDDPANGGNGDGLISAADAVFGQLRLWIDGNHDGVSQPDELMSLDTAGVVSIELSYQVTGRRDGVGNLYRYRGIVHLASGRSVPIWDVFLATTDAATTQVAVHSPRGFAAAVGHRLVQVGAWVRRAVAPRTVSALTGTRAVRAPRSSATSTTWWPADSRSVAVAGPSSNEGEPGDESSAPAIPQDPPPPPTQVVEYYHLDLLGSVRAVTNEQGTVIARHDFMPFGEELNPPTSSKDRKLFTGQERDFETGLDYFNARQYRPDLGQFTAPDPMSLAPDPVGSQVLGSYTYVSNRPLDSVDPSGMWGFNIGFGGFTWGPSGESGWGYVGGGSWAGPSGWPGSGLSLGSLFGVSLSFSIGGSPGGVGQQLAGLDIAYARMIGAGGGQGSGTQLAQGVSGVPRAMQAVTGTVDDAWCSGATCMSVLKKASDFSAGMGDTLSFGLTQSARKHLFDTDSVVDSSSGVYLVGMGTGVAVGAVAIGSELGPTGKIFGTRYAGNRPLLNSGDSLRIGWSYIRASGKYTFRIGGALVARFKSNPHINLWPPSWWFK